MAFSFGDIDLNLLFSRISKEELQQRLVEAEQALKEWKEFQLKARVDELELRVAALEGELEEGRVHPSEEQKPEPVLFKINQGQNFRDDEGRMWYWDNYNNTHKMA